MNMLRRLVNLISLALDSIMSNKGIALMIVAMNVMGLILIDTNIGNAYRVSYRSIGMEKMFEGKENSLNIMEVKTVDDGTEIYFERLSELIGHIDDTAEGVCGSFPEIYMKFDKSLFDKSFTAYIESIDPDNYNEDFTLLPTVAVKPLLIESCNIRLKKGNLKDFYKKDETATPVLIGYNLSPYLAYGEVFSDIDGKLYRVVGIMERNSGIYTESLLWGNFFATDIDDSMLVAWDYGKEKHFYGTSYFMIYAENLTKSEKDEIIAFAAKRGLVIDIKSITDALKDYKKDFYRENKLTYILMFFFMLVGIIGVSSASSVAILTHKRNFGILYSLGFSLNEITAIIIIENLIKLSLAAVISYALVAYDYGNTNSIIYRYTDIGIIAKMHATQYPYILMGIVVAISVLASIVPILLFRRQNIPQMIGGKK